MTMLTLVIMITILINYGSTSEPNRQTSLRESRSRGSRGHYATHDESSRIHSVNNLLKDPDLESFKFIYPTASGFIEKVNSKMPSKNVAVLRFRSGGKNMRKLFKIKLLLPKIIRNKHRKIRGKVIFPDNISSIKGECSWNFQTGYGRKILFVPKGCIKMIANLDRASLQNHKVFGILVPRKNKQFGFKKRKITKNFVIVAYGKRMEVLLRKLAVNKQVTRLIILMKKHETRQK